MHEFHALRMDICTKTPMRIVVKIFNQLISLVSELGMAIAHQYMRYFKLEVTTCMY